LPWFVKRREKKTEKKKKKSETTCRKMEVDHQVLSGDTSWCDAKYDYFLHERTGCRGSVFYFSYSFDSRRQRWEFTWDGSVLLEHEEIEAVLPRHICIQMDWSMGLDRYTREQRLITRTHTKSSLFGYSPHISTWVGVAYSTHHDRTRRLISSLLHGNIG
jgi:hypothetical protein